MPFRGVVQRKRLSEISSFLVEGPRQRRVKTGVRVRVNRELAILKNLYNRMHEMEAVRRRKSRHKCYADQGTKTASSFSGTRRSGTTPGSLRGAVAHPNLIALHCDIRLKSEGLTLRWEDIDFARGTVTVQAAYSKNSKPRVIPMNSLVREALERLPRKGEWVFTKPNGKPYTAVLRF